MQYQDILSANKFPTDYSKYYEKVNEPKITTQGDRKIVESTIKWNNKEYKFSWITKLNDEKEILNQLNSKINTMLALGIRYKLGEKTTSLEYSPTTNNLDCFNKDKKIKTTSLNFDDQLKKIETKIKAAGTDQTKINKLNKQKVLVEWTKNIFGEIVKQSNFKETQKIEMSNTPKLTVSKETKETATISTTPSKPAQTTTTTTINPAQTATTTQVQKLNQAEEESKMKLEEERRKQLVEQDRLLQEKKAKEKKIAEILSLYDNPHSSSPIAQ